MRQTGSDLGCPCVMTARQQKADWTGLCFSDAQRCSACYKQCCTLTCARKANGGDTSTNREHAVSVPRNHYKKRGFPVMPKRHDKGCLCHNCMQAIPGCHSPEPSHERKPTPSPKVATDIGPTLPGSAIGAPISYWIAVQHRGQQFLQRLLLSHGLSSSRRAGTLGRGTAGALSGRRSYRPRHDSRAHAGTALLGSSTCEDPLGYRGSCGHCCRGRWLQRGARSRGCRLSGRSGQRHRWGSGCGSLRRVCGSRCCLGGRCRQLRSPGSCCSRRHSGRRSGRRLGGRCGRGLGSVAGAAPARELAVTAGHPWSVALAPCGLQQKGRKAYMR